MRGEVKKKLCWGKSVKLIGKLFLIGFTKVNSYIKLVSKCPFFPPSLLLTFSNSDFHRNSVDYSEIRSRNIFRVFNKCRPIKTCLSHDDWASLGTVFSEELKVSDLGQKLFEIFVDSISEVFVARSNKHRMLV